MSTRARVKSVLARLPDGGSARGVTVLVYHRVGGGSPHELDLPVRAFVEQLEVLGRHEIVTLDAALDRLDAGDERPCVVLTFDDGFRDVHRHAYPILRDHGLPFTVYVAASFIEGELRWEGWDPAQPAAALSWAELEALAVDGLCTLGNHTWAHPMPDQLTEDELDRCSDVLADRLGSRPRHFAYPFGIKVPSFRAALASRFRSAATVEVGRNLRGVDRMALRRVPVRASDPLPFFEAKLSGSLRAERMYGTIVRAGKAVGLHA